MSRRQAAVRTIGDDDAIDDRDEQIMQPRRLISFFEGDVNRPAHPAEELDQVGAVVGRIDRAITRPPSSRTVADVVA